jgi:hypothetical protein
VFDTPGQSTVKFNNWSGNVPILIAVLLRCDAPVCVNNHEDQAGYVDANGGILYKKTGMLVWRRSGDLLGCSDACEKQLSDGVTP